MPPKLKFPAYRDRWNVGTFARMIGSVFVFPQENPLRDCHLRIQQTLRRHTRNYVRACYLRLNNVSSLAVVRIMCDVGTKSARPFIAPSSETQWGLSLIEPPSPYFHGLLIRSRSDGKKLSIPSTSSTLTVRRGAPSTNSERRPYPHCNIQMRWNHLTSGLAYRSFHHVSREPVDEIFLSSLIQPKDNTAIQYLYLWFCHQTLGHSHLQLRLQRGFLSYDSDFALTVKHEGGSRWTFMIKFS